MRDVGADTLGGMQKTGLKVAGPAYDLVELENDRGLKHIALVFHRRYRDHDSLGRKLGPRLVELQEPPTADIVPLVRHEPEAGAFIYSTGHVTPLPLVLQTLAKTSQVGGIRAGVELCCLVAEVLASLGDARGFDGVGLGLDPWRIALKSDGQIRILGAGLPAVDFLQFASDGRTTPKTDAWRYAAPEVVAGQEGGFSADLFSLCLVAFELMLGHGLYEGTSEDIRQQATNAQGPYRLRRFGDALTEPVQEMLNRALKFDEDARHRDVDDFIWEAQDVAGLPSTEGQTLAELIGVVRHRLDRPGSVVKPPPSAPEPEEEEAPERWGSVRRSGERGPQARKQSLRERIQAPRKDSKASLRDRLRRSSSVPPAPRRTSRPKQPAAEAPVPPPPPPAPAAQSSGESRASSLLARLRASREATPPPAPIRESSETDATSVEVEVHVPDRGAISVALRSDGSVADVIAEALARLGGAPTNLMGQPQVWFDAPGTDARAAAESLAESGELVLEERSVALLHVEVVMDATGQKSTLAASSACTVTAFAREVSTLFDEDSDGCSVLFGNRELPGSMVLGQVADLSDSQPLSLVIRS